MKELFSILQEWVNKKEDFAVATVIKTWGSSPRPVGSSMLINRQMEMAGSVSGGCVEGAVVKAAQDILEKGVGKQITYGVADEEAWSVGLSCGGSMQVYLEPFLAFTDGSAGLEMWSGLQACWKENRGCVLLTRLQDDAPRHWLILPDGSFTGAPLAAELLEGALTAYRERRHQVLELGARTYFAQVFPRKSQLLIVGAAHITVDLVDLAQQFGMETIVIDPRGVFANKTQFTSPPDQLFEDYPAEVLPDFELDAYTYAVILSHDPKIDDNALQILLPSEVAYIGALGSKKTHAKRVARLEKAGFSAEQIDRIHAPVGVDINAKTPKEIALSIMAELIQVKNAYR